MTISKGDFPVKFGHKLHENKQVPETTVAHVSAARTLLYTSCGPFVQLEKNPILVFFFKMKTFSSDWTNKMNWTKPLMHEVSAV